MPGKSAPWVERSVSYLGRPGAVYISCALIALWIALGELFDPAPFPLLQCVVTLLTLPLTIIILISEHRQMDAADERAKLDLKVNLAAEKKIDEVLGILEELRVAKKKENGA